jgi:hypothetical protein
MVVVKRVSGGFIVALGNLGKLLSTFSTSGAIAFSVGY